MQKTDSNSYKTLKFLFIIISIIVVAFTLTGYMLTSKEGGAVPLTSFESFYVYIITVSISLYMVINNKNANGMIVLTILTYLWTYYLVQQMIKYITDVNIIIEPLFYVYLSSAIFLVISLFFNDKKTDKNVKTNFQNLNNNVTDSLDKNNFLFANFILGMKGIPFNTEVLLVNNVPDNSLDLIYAIDNNNQTIKLPIGTIRNISYKTSMQIQNISKKTESNETKSMLLSAVVFGGNPMLQLAGNSAFNSMFDEISNNYDKVNFNSYYEITIETLINGQEVKFIMNTKTYPNEFVKPILNKIIK